MHSNRSDEQRKKTDMICFNAVNGVLSKLCDLIEDHQLTSKEDVAFAHTLALAIFKSFSMDGGVAAVLSERNLRVPEPRLFSELSSSQMLSMEQWKELITLLNNVTEQSASSALTSIMTSLLAEAKNALAALPAAHLESEEENDSCVLVYRRMRTSSPLHFFSTPGNILSGEIFATKAEAENYLQGKAVIGQPVIVEVAMSLEKARVLLSNRDEVALDKQIRRIAGSSVTYENGKFEYKVK